MPRVSVQVDTWTAKFKDENDKIRRIPTKETNRKIAEQILAQYEKEVARIKTGIITREELDKAQVKHTPLDGLLDQYLVKVVVNPKDRHRLAEAARFFRGCHKHGEGTQRHAVLIKNLRRNARTGTLSSNEND